jgi:HrpA-like RNA helicase
MDKPPRESIQSAFKRLFQLGAIKSIQNHQLTNTGFKMTKFPLEPSYSKMIIAAQRFDCTNEIVDLIAVLSSENLFYEPHNDRKEAALVQHAKFASKYGDHQTYLNIFSQFMRAENPVVSFLAN